MTVTRGFPTCMPTLPFSVLGKVSSIDIEVGADRSWQRALMFSGDNTILSLQSGRALISSWADAKKGKTLAPGVAYMSEKSNMNAKSTGKLDLQDIDQAWACVATNVVKKAADDFAAHVAKGSTKDEAMEKCSQSRFIAAKLHTIGYVSLHSRFELERADSDVSSAVLDFPNVPSSMR
jgi:acyl-CoA oxidase